MATTGVTLTFNRGDDVTITTTISGSGSIASWTLAFKAWRSEDNIDADAGDEVISKALASGIAITDAALRIVTITLAAADTASLEAGREYPFRFRRTNSGSRATLTEGKISLSL